MFKGSFTDEETWAGNNTFEIGSTFGASKERNKFDSTASEDWGVGGSDEGYILIHQGSIDQAITVIWWEIWSKVRN